MIRLRDIHRDFPVGDQIVHALDGIDEHIEAGEHVAIMGPSGSGKSTLLNILGCLDRPSAGSYRFQGEEVGRLGDHELTLVRRHRIGFIFQSFHLVPRLDSLSNVELPMLFAGIPRRQRRQRARDRLEEVGLSMRADHRPDQLSGGERQRVAIARAMVMQPALLLADEPTGNLDTKSGWAILELLKTLNASGVTLVVVTHDPRVAARADRIVLLQDGCITFRAAGTEIDEAVARITAIDGDEAFEARS